LAQLLLQSPETHIHRKLLPATVPPESRSFFLEFFSPVDRYGSSRPCPSTSFHPPSRRDFPFFFFLKRNSILDHARRPFFFLLTQRSGLFTFPVNFAPFPFPAAKPSLSCGGIGAFLLLSSTRSYFLFTSTSSFLNPVDVESLRPFMHVSLLCGPPPFCP